MGKGVTWSVGTRWAGRCAWAAAAALLVSACGRPALNLGRLIDPVPEDSIALNLILIGDAGLPDPDGEPVLEALRREISWDTTRTLVVYLGDNVYPHGLPDSTAPDRAEAERILREQMRPLLETGARGVFVPGNHDWDAGSPSGLAYVVRQQRWVEANGEGRIDFAPDDGCPGPTVRDEGEVLRLVVLDTQWWLHGLPQPPACRASTAEAVVDSIRRVLASAGDRRTVVVGHHPMVSGGEHGGYFDWPTYLFPFHPWVRLGGFFARQDVSGREYRAMRTELGRAFAADEPLVYAAGHEHNLQVLRREPARWLLVSGGGIYNHTTATRAITGTRYVRRASGFMRLTFLRDGRVRLAVIVVDAEGNGTEDFSAWLEEERITPPAAQGDTANAQQSTTP
ncbi:MAG TPA: metallophosphoesterase [Longimicrobiaceae bacterium]|nr:metallophosphoesterase [Longimicrobiaceae bacterium]